MTKKTARRNKSKVTKNKADRLTRFENDYFWETQNKARDAEVQLKQAQDRYNEAFADAQGCFKMLQRKYNIGLKDGISPNGEVQRNQIDVNKKQ